MIEPQYSSAAELLTARNAISAEIGARQCRGEPIEDLLRQAQELKARLKFLAGQQRESAGADLTCGVASSADDICALRDEWRALAHACPAGHLFSTWEWAEAWYAVHAACGEIHCVVVRQSGRLVGLAPLFVPAAGDGNLAGRQAGFLGTWGPSWGHYPEFLVAPGHEADVIDAVLAHLAQAGRNWRGIKLMRMKPSSPTLPRLVQQAPRHGLRFYLRPGLTTALADLPADPEEVLEGYARKHRNDTRRALKHLAAEHPGAAFRVVSDGHEALRLLEAVKQLNIARRQSKEADSHFSRPDYCECFDRSGRNFLEAGWVRGAALCDGGEIVSATYGVIHGDCLYIINSGFRPEYARYNPSYLALLNLSQQAVREGVRHMDMLTWYPYKTVVCPIREQLVDVMLFADHYRGVATVAGELMQRSARLAVKRLFGKEHPSPV